MKTKFRWAMILSALPLLPEAASAAPSDDAAKPAPSGGASAGKPASTSGQPSPAKAPAPGSKAPTVGTAGGAASATTMGAASGGSQPSGSGALSATPGAGLSGGAALPECDSEKAEVDVDVVTGGGWVVTRKAACPDETYALLSYSFGAVVGREVVGKKGDDTWAFGIPDEIPSDAIVKLEFRVYSKLGLDAQKKAEQAVSDFGAALVAEVTEAFREADAMTKNVPEKERHAALLLIMNGKLRDRLRDLIAEATLSKYYMGQVRASEFALEQIGFRRVGSGEYEPTPQVYKELEIALDAERRNWNAQEQIRAYQEANGFDSCLGDRANLVGESATAAARETGLKSCLEKFVVSARKGLLAPTAPAKAALDRLESISKKPASEVVASVVREKDTEVGKGPREKVTLLVRNEVDEVQGELGEAPAQETVKARAARTLAVDAVNRAAEAIDYAAALVEAEREATAVEKRVIVDKFKVKASELNQLLVFARQGRASEFVRVTPGKPRFFVSTGVVVSSLSSDEFLGDPWKAALPVMVSICWWTTGCETKGMGSGGPAVSYFSLDLGVKAIFLGDRDPREGAPSFLLGLGGTPFFATHFSAGLNIFDNPQTEEINVAPYLGVTIDLVDGADILGHLGISSPQVQRIGTSSSEGKK